MDQQYSRAVKDSFRAKLWHAAALALLIALILGAKAAAAPLPCPIPLEKGNQWTYEATVRWTPVNSPALGPHHLRWEMTVREVVTNRHARAAVVRGMPDDLTWYEPGKQPEYGVLVCTSNMVYRFGAKTEKEANAKARRILKAPVLSVLNEFLMLPLAEGKEWAADTGNRDDHWYRWYVELAGREKHQVKGFATDRSTPTWRIAYRTCPDEQVMEIAEGLGITRYFYEHHGTVAFVDSRLVSFKRLGK